MKIKAFAPQNFWYISCEVEFASPDNDRNLTCSFQWDRTRLYDRLGCLILYEMCLEGGGVATVVACESKPTSRWRPCPLNTIELTKRASRSLEFITSFRTQRIYAVLVTIKVFKMCLRCCLYVFFSFVGFFAWARTALWQLQKPCISGASYRTRARRRTSLQRAASSCGRC